MTNYKKGDKIKFTDELRVLVTPFTSIVIPKGTECTVLEVGVSHYSISNTQDSAVIIVDKSKVNEATLFIDSKHDDKQFNVVLETGLTFGQAVDKAINENMKVTRKIWGGYWQKQILQGTDESPNWQGEFLVAVLKDGGHAVATPYQADMFAKDWMVVK
ncbi:Thoeris anti-defense Tad2 family protein [Viridibacillus arvi]|uniref:Thoeris anti-defense Tad2 family protein n=1 Tax=Viridibacillus arvi TaxID=263475 RepID=UPI0034CEBE35